MSAYGILSGWLSRSWSCVSENLSLFFCPTQVFRPLLAGGAIAATEFSSVVFNTVTVRNCTSTYGGTWDLAQS